MESCSQDVKIIKEALKRRQELFCAQDVPAQEELHKSQGNVMGKIILDGMSPMAQFLMQADRVHKPPIFKLWISPESRTKKKICVTEASRVENIQALTHDGVLELGATVEKKYEKKFLKMLKKAIEQTSEYERFECERRLHFALKVQQEIYVKKLNEIENKLRDEFDRERLEMQTLYDSKYGQIISDIIQSTNQKYQKIIDDLKANCTCVESEVVISSTSVSTVSSLKMSSGSTPSLEPDAKILENKNEGSELYAAKRIWNDFEHHLRTQKNILQCSNICDLVHFICTEKLESQRRVENVQREACEKIELLKSFLFDICCKIRNMECQCSGEKEVQVPKCLGLKFCRCEHQKIGVSNDEPNLSKLVCSCCGKKINDIKCDGKYPMRDKRKSTCKCSVKTHEDKGDYAETFDIKLSCFCGKEETIKDEHKPEKKLCYVCRAKKICSIVANMKWPQPPKPPCICSERNVDPSIPCQCQHGNNTNNFGKYKNQDFFAAAVVLPEYIGKQIYCECQSSSSEDECPCLDTEDLLAKNKNLVNVCWKQVEDNVCVQLKDYNKDLASTESSSDIISNLEEEEKKKLISSESTSSTPSQLPAENLRKKLITDLDAEELVECVFSLSTPENLENPDYIKRRLAEEIKSKIEKIFIREEPKERTTESFSQGSTTTTSVSQERLIDHLLEIDKEKEDMNIYMETQLRKPTPVSTECKLNETSRDIWKNYIPLPKYTVPIASLFEGGWCYTQTTDEDWKVITKLIENNKFKEEN